MKTRRSAALSLAVLIGHLVFMASPLHADVLGPPHGEWSELQMTVQPEHDGEGAEELSARREMTIDHCAIEVAPPPSRPLVPAPADVSLPSSMRCPIASAPTGGPFPMGTGPPEPADSQALLQVFRI